MYFVMNNSGGQQSRFIILNHSNDILVSGHKELERQIFFASMDNNGVILRSEDIEVYDKEGRKKHEDWRILFYNSFRPGQCQFFLEVIAEILEQEQYLEHSQIKVFIHRGGESLKNSSHVRFWDKERVGGQTISSDLANQLTRLKAKGIPMSRGSKYDFQWSNGIILAFDALMDLIKKGENHQNHVKLYNNLDLFFQMGFEHYTKK